MFTIVLPFAIIFTMVVGCITGYNNGVRTERARIRRDFDAMLAKNHYRGIATPMIKITQSIIERPDLVD